MNELRRRNEGVEGLENMEEETVAVFINSELLCSWIIATIDSYFLDIFGFLCVCVCERERERERKDRAERSVWAVRVLGWGFWSVLMLYCTHLSLAQTKC